MYEFDILSMTCAGTLKKGHRAGRSCVTFDQSTSAPARPTSNLHVPEALAAVIVESGYATTDKSL